MESNSEQIIDEIFTYLDKSLLKKSKITGQDIINFIEEKWAQADNEKYNIHGGYICIARMVREYGKLHDLDNMMRWLDEGDKHTSSKKNELYVLNYYKGERLLDAGFEEKALEYLWLCYNENADYIFTRAPFCYEFFNKHLTQPKELDREEDEDEDEYFEYDLQLNNWTDFIDNELNTAHCLILNEDGCEGVEATEKHRKGMDYLKENQTPILEAILNALLAEYPKLQQRYNFSEEDKADFMPDISDIRQFADLLSLLTIYITSECEDDIPQIGFLFSCSWDGEHGFGVMTHKNKIIEMGGADTAFLI